MPPPKIHPSAIIAAGARLAPTVEIGAFSIIEDDVTLGENVCIGPHTVIRSHTEIGAHSRIYQFCSIGEAPQHQAYAGEPTRLQIGARNTIREYCTLNRGTAHGKGITRIGDDNLIMAYAHIAHDCTLGNHIIFANGASLAGHVAIGDHAILGGFSLVHQFCNIGAHSITGISTICFKDVPPYIIAAKNPAKPYGINTTGLRRRDFSPSTLKNLRQAYRLLYRSNLDLKSAIAQIADLAAAKDPTTTNPDPDTRTHLTLLCDFLRQSKRGIIR